MNSQTLNAIFRNAVAIALVAMLQEAPSADAASYKWDISPDPGIQSGSGTWDTTSTLWTLTDGASNTAWVNGNDAVFSGTSAPEGTSYQISLTPSISLGLLNVSRNGYVFNAASLTSLSLSRISVSAGSRAVFGANLAIAAGASNSFEGEMEIHGTVTTPASTHLTFKQALATLTSTGNINSSLGVVLSGTLFVNGGSMTTGGFSGPLVLGNSTSETASSRLVINGGSVKLNASTLSGANLRFGPASGTTGSVLDMSVELNGGELEAGKILKGTVSNYKANIIFNSGTLRVMEGSTSGADFMSGLDKAMIRNGGITIDTNGVNTTIAQALLHSDQDGDAAKDGGVTKTGAGTLTLSGANTYTGDTRVEEGTLRLTNAVLHEEADVYLSAGSFLDLNFAGTNTINALYIDGIPQAVGIWGALGSDADYTSALITGAGYLDVTAIPEPGSFLLLGVGAAVVFWRRRRG